MTLLLKLQISLFVFHYYGSHLYEYHHTFKYLCVQLQKYTHTGLEKLKGK